MAREAERQASDRRKGRLRSEERRRIQVQAFLPGVLVFRARSIESARPRRKSATRRTNAARAAAMPQLHFAARPVLRARHAGPQQGIGKASKPACKSSASQLDRRREKKSEIIDLQAKVAINEADGLGFYGQPKAIGHRPLSYAISGAIASGRRGRISTHTPPSADPVV